MPRPPLPACLGALVVVGCGDLGRGPDPLAEADIVAVDAIPSEVAADTMAEVDVAPSCDPAKPIWGRGEALMLPGTDCLGCHMAGQAATRHPYTLAGTVFGSRACPTAAGDAVIRVVDHGGAVVDLAVTAAGNFYTDRPLAPPWRLSLVIHGVQTPMGSATSDGRCNSCHQPGAIGYIAPKP